MAENEEFQNKLYTGDNLYILEGLETESVDLIYLDPPFNSKRIYEAPVGSKAQGTSFKDIWTWDDVDKYHLEEMYKDYPDLVRYIDTIGNLHSTAMMSYITFMAQRVIEMHRILKPTGSLYYHCDPTAGHFVKLLLDGVFGRKNFRNECLWIYEDNANSKKYYNRKHDTIYFYTKSDNYYFNPYQIMRPLSENTIKKFKYEDEKGKYRLMGRGLEGSPIKSARDISPEWEKTHPELTFRHYLKDGALPLDWINIPPINQNAKERVGYPTQKPLALLERFILASCPENGVVLDPFCGCATTCVAAQKLGRHWIGIDIEEKAVDLLIQRLSEGGDDSKDKSKIKANKGMFNDFMATSIVPVRSDKKFNLPEQPKKASEIKEILAQKQDFQIIEEGKIKEKTCICNGCKGRYKLKDLAIDHIIPKSKGGQDVMENYQLLCGNCNSIKSNNTMDKLRKRLIEIRQMKEHNWFD